MMKSRNFRRCSTRRSARSAHWSLTANELKVRMNRGRTSLKRGPSPAIPVSAALLLSGCFFDQLQRSEESDIQRVDRKQATLQTEQYRSDTLKQQEEQL